MIWVTSENYIPVTGSMGRAIGGIKANRTENLIIPSGMYGSADPIPHDRWFIRERAKLASQKMEASNNPAQKIIFTGFGILVFTEEDTWWPHKILVRYGFPEVSWVSALLVAQFYCTEDMSEEELRTILASPNIDLPYGDEFDPLVALRINDLKPIISKRSEA